MSRLPFPLSLRQLLIGGLLMLGAWANAAPQAGLEQLARDWLQPAVDQALAQDGALPLRAEVVMGNLDSRLRLAPCQAIEPYLPPGTKLWGRSRIGLRCTDGVARWNVYVPVTIKAFGPAWVLKAPVAAGETLTQDQAELTEVDWASHPSPVLATPERWVGQTTAYALSPGQTLRENMVRAQTAFEAGSPVKVVSGGNGFAVSVTGQAISEGRVGETARVRLPSGKVVNGVVRPDQTVELAM